VSLDMASSGNESGLTPPGVQHEEHVRSLIAALENPEFDWRTVRGISRETGLSEDQIEEVLSKIEDILVQSYDGNGKPIFTTRKHYNERESLGHKILSAIADTVK